jgi:hypothetical protein
MNGGSFGGSKQFDPSKIVVGGTSWTPLNLNIGFCRDVCERFQHHQASSLMLIELWAELNGPIIHRTST